MPRRARIRTDADMAHIYNRMPSVLRERARVLYEELDEVELEDMGVQTSTGREDLTCREVVLLAEQIISEEQALDLTDETLKETEEDYRATPE